MCVLSSVSPLHMWAVLEVIGTRLISLSCCAYFGPCISGMAFIPRYWSGSIRIVVNLGVAMRVVGCARALFGLWMRDLSMSDRRIGWCTMWGG